MSRVDPADCGPHWLLLCGILGGLYNIALWAFMGSLYSIQYQAKDPSPTPLLRLLFIPMFVLLRAISSVCCL